MIITDWYWDVIESGKLYSSKRADYVDRADADYLQWLQTQPPLAPPDGLKPAAIDTAYNLGRTLAPALLRPVPQDVLDGYLAALNDNKITGALLDHESRLSAIETQLGIVTKARPPI